MLSTGIPELQKESDVKWVQDKLFLDHDDEQAAEEMKRLIKEAKGCFTTKMNDFVHVAVH